MSASKKDNKRGGAKSVNHSLSWAHMMMKKWLNIKSIGDQFGADEYNAEERLRDDTGLEEDSECKCENEDEESRKNLKCDGRQPEDLHRQYFDTEEMRVAVGTWNVAGRTPPPCLDLNSWLEMDDAADVYVLGFQEIVSLNAGNVFGVEDSGPTLEWQALIRKTLNRASSKACTSYSAPPSPSREAASSEASSHLSGDSEIEIERVLIDEEISFIPSDLRRSQSQRYNVVEGDIEDNLIEVYRCTERIGLNKAGLQRSNSTPINWLSHPPLDAGSSDVVRPLLSSITIAHVNPARKHIRYVQVASKQMVGIHISVWVRKKLRRCIYNLTVSSVGLGIMGCMGNKGSISVSLRLHETSFCFVCTHLSSGEKEGDEVLRNAEVTEILKRTRFPSTNAAYADVPKTIWDHDRIIWFGDLNYRLNLSDSKVRFLVAREDWTALLKKDQLKKELLRGHIFDGWHEGSISFAPTYKYEEGSDQYAGESAKHGEKRRAPAWCDRILWRGRGLKQMSYRREELTLSDHRPVIAKFLAHVEVFGDHKFNTGILFKIAKVEAEELLSRIEHPIWKAYLEQKLGSLFE